MRLAQYETGSRKPKAEFALEDIYGLTVSETDGDVCLKVSKGKGKDAAESPAECHVYSLFFIY